jgi:hypothetical protein
MEGRLIHAELLVEWEVTGHTEVLGNKSPPVPLCPPQVPYDLTWNYTRTAAVGIRRLLHSCKGLTTNGLLANAKSHQVRFFIFACALPVLTSSFERSFSQRNLRETKFTSSLWSQHLIFLMAISYIVVSMTEYDPKLATHILKYTY